MAIIWVHEWVWRTPGTPYQVYEGLMYMGISYMCLGEQSGFPKGSVSREILRRNVLDGLQVTSSSDILRHMSDYMSKEGVLGPWKMTYLSTRKGFPEALSHDI